MALTLSHRWVRVSAIPRSAGRLFSLRVRRTAGTASITTNHNDVIRHFSSGSGTARRGKRPGKSSAAAVGSSTAPPRDKMSSGGGRRGAAQEGARMSSSHNNNTRSTDSTTDLESLLSEAPTSAPVLVTNSGRAPQLAAASPRAATAMLDANQRALSAANIGETVSSGAAHSSMQQVERRRSKWAVAESEFETGVTERLFPEIRRLEALHEVHYGDAVVREIDGHVYFSTHRASNESEAVHDDAPQLMGGNLKDIDVGGDEEEDDDDKAFAAFDDAGSRAGIANNSSAPAPSPSPSPSDAIDHSTEGSSILEAHSIEHGLEKPWFIDAATDGGVCRLKPLSHSDCVLTMSYILQLRGLSTSDLPAVLQRKVKRAEALARGVEDSKPKPKKGKNSRTSEPLKISDIIEYLDSAPAPIKGFTEDLNPHSGPFVAPAYVFTMYVENVSLQNAFGHFAALFGIPEKSFFANSAASKMSCSSVICVVSRNRLKREHLLLINTMRHPGFVVRVSGIVEVKDDKKADALFGDLSRWQSVFETDVILRRVHCKTKEEIEHRLRATQQIGAIFFCANREASLVRAATDVLHGFYKSAIINALNRRKPPLAMKQFLARPNVITAARARRVSTDAAIRQVLKAFVATNGDWKETVGRTSYVLRRRWINALRASVWNKMASKRVRAGGRNVLVGDVVIKAAYRSDAHHRLLTTLKSEHVKLVETEEEAAEYTLEDVVMPFLRGKFPSALFAPESSQHPVMTESSMLAILREAHATQLLLGLDTECKALLDIRVDVSPMLWRRLLIRPIAMEFSILEDKAPVRSVHFDAGRLLRTDRWGMLGQQGISAPSSPCEGDNSTTSRAFPTTTSSLIPQAEILEKTTIGARLSAGMLSEEFFSVPLPDHYVVLGQAQRMLAGQFVPSAPHTPERELSDRVFSVHIRAITRSGAVGLTQVLREYFALGGIERESDSALQHKVHRMRRELDPETPLITAPSYCTACYNRDHDSIDLCAEYLYKRNRRANRKWSEQVIATSPPTPLSIQAGQEKKRQLQLGHDAAAAALPRPRLRMTLRLHRRSLDQKWGVHMTKTLRLTGMEDLSLVAKGTICTVASPSESPDDVVSAEEEGEDVVVMPWPVSLTDEIRNQQQSDVVVAADAEHSNTNSNVESIARFLIPFLPSTEGADALASQEPLQFSWAENQETQLPLSAKVTIVSDAAENTEVANVNLRQCAWRLVSVDTTSVSDRRDVATAFVKRAKDRDVTLVFETDVTFPAHHRRPERGQMGQASGEAAQLLPSGKDKAHTERLTTEAVRSLLLASTPQAQRWVSNLPDTVQLVLSKHRRHVLKNPSWGLRIDAADMALINFVPLMVQYMFSTTEPKEQMALGEQAYVSSMSPESAFSKDNAKVADTLFSDILPRLDGVLNQMYSVARINGKEVRHPDEAATIVKSFREEVEGVVRGMKQGKLLEEATYHLPLVLRRKPESYTWLSSSPAVGTPQQQQQTVNPEEKVKDASIPLCSPHRQARHALTQKQLQHQTVTIAINRRIINPRTEGRWGIRIQRGTCRLRKIQHDRSFTFQVFAAKRQQGVRISDTLRYQHQKHQHRAEEDNNNALSDMGAEENATEPPPQQFYSHYLYFIQAVNHEPVSHHHALRSAMQKAAGIGSSASAPESVTLQVQQYALARLNAVVRRGGPGEPSAMSPVGLSVNTDLCVTSIAAGSAMEKAVLASTSNVCSLRRLLASATEDTKGSPVALPDLAKAYTAVAASLKRLLGPGHAPPAAEVVQSDRRHQYLVDEDEEDGNGPSNRGCDEEHLHKKQSMDTLRSDLDALLQASGRVLDECQRASDVDGVHLQQASLLFNYTTAELERLGKLLLSNKGEAMDDEGKEKIMEEFAAAAETLEGQLIDVYSVVRWRVIYAMQSGNSMRTVADVQAAVAPGVAEETLVLQQCIAD